MAMVSFHGGHTAHFGTASVQALAGILTADKRARTWQKGPYGNFGQSSVF